MTPEKLSSQYRELAESRLPLSVLNNVFAAKLTAAAKKENGTTLKAAAALGTTNRTLDRWTVAGRLQQISEQQECTINRIALHLFATTGRPEPLENKKLYEAIFAAFHQGIAKAAVGVARNKTNAAKQLGVCRDYVGKLIRRSA